MRSTPEASRSLYENVSPCAAVVQGGVPESPGGSGGGV